MATRGGRTLPEQYKPYLCKVMAFKDSGQGDYPRTMEFSQEQLLQLTPLIVSRFLKKLAYGAPNPGPNDPPIHARSTHLEQAKKAISHFMPNQQAWVVEYGVGNPTRSAIVNQVIKDVKKAEVRRVGRASNAKRDMKRPEFRKTLRLLEYRTDFECASKYTAMAKLQFHIIGRSDDICNLETADIRSHDQFPDFALQMRVSCVGLQHSKNYIGCIIANIVVIDKE